MSGTPKYKVFNPGNEYVAAFKHLEDAAMFIAAAGEGYQVRFEHAKKSTIWVEGGEAFPASESYDEAARIMRERESESNYRAYLKVYGAGSAEHL